MNRAPLEPYGSTDLDPIHVLFREDRDPQINKSDEIENTFLDYYQYQPAWPKFQTVTHLIGNGMARGPCNHFDFEGKEINIVICKAMPSLIHIPMGIITMKTSTFKQLW